MSLSCLSGLTKRFACALWEHTGRIRPPSSTTGLFFMPISTADALSPHTPHRITFALCSLQPSHKLRAPLLRLAGPSPALPLQSPRKALTPCFPRRHENTPCVAFCCRPPASLKSFLPQIKRCPTNCSPPDIFVMYELSESYYSAITKLFTMASNAPPYSPAAASG